MSCLSEVGKPISISPALSEALLECERLRAALAELVRLKDLKTDAEAINTSGDWNAVHKMQAMLSEYREKRGEAWDAARRALMRASVPTTAQRAIDADQT